MDAVNVIVLSCLMFALLILATNISKGEKKGYQIIPITKGKKVIRYDVIEPNKAVSLGE